MAGVIIQFPTHIVAVAGLISNAEDKVLLVKNVVRGWEFPGGQVENGEDLITALKREIEEESGILAYIGHLAGVYSNIKPEVSYVDGSTPIPTKVIFDFVGTEIGGALSTSDETTEVGWYERSEVLNMVTQPFIRDRMKNLLSFEGKVLYRAYSKNPYTIHKEHNI